MEWEIFRNSLALRHEGSSKFGAKHKWGNFPAVSVGWRISQESSWRMPAAGSDELKIRADYGETGNQDFSSYQSIPTMKGFGHYLIDGKFVQVWATENNVNPDLHWEKSKNWNVGIDFSMFNNRFGGSLNYYNRRTEDLLGTYHVACAAFCA
ncbi:MAG: TonB-dependent receptor domain-containing protein [Alistipes communis]